MFKEWDKETAVNCRTEDVDKFLMLLDKNGYVWRNGEDSLRNAERRKRVADSGYNNNLCFVHGFNNGYDNDSDMEIGISDIQYYKEHGCKIITYPEFLTLIRKNIIKVYSFGEFLNEKYETEKLNTVTIKKHLIKDNKVIIKLSNDKQGVAFCNSEDKFDIFKGTELAVKRAYGKEEPEKEEKEFKIGDRVKCINRALFRELGEVGTIINVFKNWFTVEFDNEIGGHDGKLSGKSGKEGHCAYALPENLQLISETKTDKKPIPTSAKNLIGKYAIRVKKVNGDGSYMSDIVKILAADDYGLQLQSDDTFVFYLSAEWLNDWVDRTNWKEPMAKAEPKIIKQDKYKVGDKVKIKTLAELRASGYCHSEECAGKILTIETANISSLSGVYFYTMKEDKCNWRSETIAGKAIGDNKYEF